MSLLRPSLGVLGGMGPRSSAEFMCTFYECASDGRVEQELPAAVLLSEPGLPDRMRSLLSGDHGEFRDGLERGLQRLLECGCQELVICCFAAHHLVPLLSVPVRSRLRSLLDATLDELRTSPRSLVMCSSSTRALALLERQPGWAEVEPRAVFPSEADQETINRMIGEVKSTGATEAMAASLDRIVTGYGVFACVFACTELHMLNRLFENRAIATSYRRLDPLYSLARKLCAREPERSVEAV
jgi:aspartate racemase